MSTFTLTNPDTPTETHGDLRVEAPADDFSILEQRVLRAVELLRAERSARAAAEGTAAALQQLLDEQSEQLSKTEARVQSLEDERRQVRARVERMMQQLDEIG